MTAAGEGAGFHLPDVRTGLRRRRALRSIVKRFRRKPVRLRMLSLEPLPEDPGGPT